MKRILIALVLAAGAAHAAESPRPGMLDPHIQTVQYNPDQVVRLMGYFGYQTMVEFADDEKIENVAIGDSLGWQVTPNKRANILFVKPIDRRAVTNMTVVTDRRRYFFSLQLAPAGTTTAKAAWVVRFRYPAPVIAVAEAPPPPPLPDPSQLNFSYTTAGSKALYPSRVFDDGRSTYFEFGAGTPMPAIFAIGADGKETIVNYSVKDKYTIVQQTAGRFILRSGKSVATITNAGTRAPAPQRFALQAKPGDIIASVETLPAGAGAPRQASKKEARR